MIEIKKRGNQEIELEGKRLKITNLGKLYFPDDGITKGDLIEYYIRISPVILKYLNNRPESLHRFPNGIYGKNFYQKNVGNLPPEWVETVKVESNENRTTEYLIISNLASLVYTINLGCIDLNPWNSQSTKLEYPDYLIIDLDPELIDFEYVVETALVAKKVCDELGLASYPKTSGATGMHIWLPLSGKYSYDQTRNFAEILVNLIFEETQQFTSIERSPNKRKGKVYLDYLQNSKGQTLAAPYSIRPRRGAPVSTPLEWSEVTRELRPADFNLKNIFDRLSQIKDPWISFFAAPSADFESALKKIKN